MVTDKVLHGERIHLRSIELDDCSSRYVDWLNDPDVNQYLETKWQYQTIEMIREFVAAQRENDHSVLFAIILNDGNRHIGNIKIGPINRHHKHGDISYFIGEKELWGKGIATEAIRLVCKFSFDECNLHRVEAGAYAVATGSWKALEKIGFKREGIFREQIHFNNSYIDVFRYGLLKSEWENNPL